MDARAHLMTFREGWYACLERRADATFELTDALLCADGPVSSFPRLSLDPEFRRGWGSGYAALAKGRVDMESVRDLLVSNRPADWPLVFAVDASTMERCDAETSPDRGFYHHPSKHSAGKADLPASRHKALKYTQCLQQHGINASTSSSGNRVAIRVSGGGNGQQQAQAAMAACKK